MYVQPGRHLVCRRVDVLGDDAEAHRDVGEVVAPGPPHPRAPLGPHVGQSRPRVGPHGPRVGTSREHRGALGEAS